MLCKFERGIFPCFRFLTFLARQDGYHEGYRPYVSLFAVPCIRGIEWLHRQIYLLLIESPQQRSRCSLPPLMPKWVVLLNHNVSSIAYGISLPSCQWPLRYNSSTSESVSEREAFGFLLFPEDFRAFCFSFRTSGVPANSMELTTEKPQLFFFRYLSMLATIHRNQEGSLSLPSCLRTETINWIKDASNCSDRSFSFLSLRKVLNNATSWEVFLAVFLFSFSSKNWEINLHRRHSQILKQLFRW